MNNITKFEVYVDGACKGNPGRGGWGVLIKWDCGVREIFGGESDTTNNRMELTAPIKALESLPIGCEVKIHTDSQYVKNGMTFWVKGWKKKGWRSSSGGEVKNRDLWEKLDNLNSKVKAEWIWVRGHNGHEGNETADRLANKGVG